MELARGSVADRPWGVTLGGLALRGFSGELVVTADHKRCAIVLLDGVVAAASSSFAADSIARVALTSHLVSSSQVGEITKQLAAAPSRDELDVLAETAHLSPEQTQRLRVRLIAQRAARTFSIDDGAYVLDDQVTLQAVPGSEVDMRAVVYQGARMYLSEQRLADDLRQLGSHFTLDPRAFDEVHKFGFTDDELPIINALRTGACLAELEALHREIDPRTMQALVYALASCNAVTAIHTPRAPTPVSPPQTGCAATLRPGSSPELARTTTPIDGVHIGRAASKAVVPRTITPREPSAPRTITPREPSAPRTITPREPRAPRTITPREPSVTRTQTKPFAGRAPTRQPFVDTRVDPPAPGRAHTPRELMSDRIDMAAVGRAATPARTATSQGIGMRGPTAREPTPSRIPTRPGVGRMSSEPGSPEPRTIDSQNDRERAEEAVKRGEGAMRAENFESALFELARACELVPNNLDYAALLAWVRFCLASDKEVVAAETRRVLEKAIHRGDKPIVACFYLGRVERMLGRESEALRRFREVLDQQPTHADAASEVRILEARMAANAKR